MFILQPINRWGPQPIKSYHVTGTFWAGREIIKWGFHGLVMELEREKHCFQNEGEELNESSEKTWGGGCLQKTWVEGPWMFVVERLVLEGWRVWLGERQREVYFFWKVLWLLWQTVPGGWAPTLAATPSLLNLIKQTFALQKIWNVINSTLKYVLNLLLSQK